MSEDLNFSLSSQIFGPWDPIQWHLALKCNKEKADFIHSLDVYEDDYKPSWQEFTVLAAHWSHLGELLGIVLPLAVPQTQHFRISGSGIRQECFWKPPGEASDSQHWESPALGWVNSWWIPIAFLWFYWQGAFSKCGTHLHHHHEYMKHELHLDAFVCMASFLQFPSWFNPCRMMLW